VTAQELTMKPDEEIADDSNLERINSVAPVESEAQQRDGQTEVENVGYIMKGLLRSFGRLLYERRHHWFPYSIAVLGILGAASVYPLQAFVFANVIQVLTYPGDQLISKGNFWAGMYGVIAAVVLLSYFILYFAAHLISISLTRHYHQEYLDNMIRKPITFFDPQGHTPGLLTSSLSSDTMQFQQIMSTEMAIGLIAVVSLVGSLIIAFVYGWKLSLVSLFAALPPILAAGYSRMRLEIQSESMNAKVFESSSQFATEAVGAFRTVLSLVMEDMIGDWYQTLLADHVTQGTSKAKWSTLVFAASDSVELACMALVFWYGGTLLASHEYSLVDFFVIYMAIVQGAAAAGMWFSFAPNMAQASAAANRILSMRPPKSYSLPSYLALRNSAGGAGIEFQNVCFTYSSHKVPVLRELNMKVLPGQFAALVGASGCGKSTTISLLERFYDTTSGQILYNNQDIASLDPSEYRKQVSLVSQEPTLYEGTINDNIALSVDTANRDEIVETCKDAQIHDFITSLPEGYNTRLGPKGMS
jgi:ATP-binding cassette subfamily B (MDR/TAP) protein 1